MDEKTTKRLHVPDLDADLYWMVKKAAADQRITLKQWVIDALKAHLAKQAHSTATAPPAHGG